MILVTLCGCGVLTIAALLGLMAALIAGHPAAGAAPDQCALVNIARSPPLQGLEPKALADLSRTIWAEGRGESLCGQTAIGFVVVNRIASNRDEWGYSVSEVVRKPNQFAVWNGAKKHRRLMLLDQSDPAFRTAQLAAALALSHAVSDPTGGSTHFIATRIKPPAWARHMIARRIGRHTFYKAR